MRRGVEELYAAYKEHGLDEDTLLGPRFQRIRHLQRLMREGRVSDDLRWTSPAAAGERE